MQNLSIGKKLRSENGATLIIALVFLLVISIIGGIVLSAANATSHGLMDIHEDEQGYMYLSSSCDLLKSELLNAELQTNGSSTTAPVLNYEIITSCNTTAMDKSVPFTMDLKKGSSSISAISGKLKVNGGTLMILLNYGNQYMTMRFRSTSTGTSYKWTQCEILKGAEKYE